MSPAEPRAPAPGTHRAPAAEEPRALRAHRGTPPNPVGPRGKAWGSGGSWKTETRVLAGAWPSREDVCAPRNGSLRVLPSRPERGDPGGLAWAAGLAHLVSFLPRRALSGCLSPARLAPASPPTGLAQPSLPRPGDRGAAEPLPRCAAETRPNQQPKSCSSSH